MLHFHKEGAKTILGACLLTVAIVFAADYFLKENFWLLKTIQIVALVFLVIILQFLETQTEASDQKTKLW